MSINNPPPFPYISGQWSPRKATQQFPQAKQLKSAEQLSPYNRKSYDEHRVSTSSGRSMGVYLRQDYTENPNPPIVVIVGGAGFGGTVPANSWHTYLENWNPILIDARGAGNSLPLGDKEAASIDGTTDDFLDVLAQFGISKAGIIGYSFAGTLALSLAGKMNGMGLPVPFVAGISPTMCKGDKEWCFQHDKISGTLRRDVSDIGQARWENLVELVNTEATAENVLSTYSQLLRSEDTGMAIDASVRMNLWEDVPYLIFPENNFFDAINKGLRPGKTLQDFYAELAKGNANLDDFFCSEDEIENDNTEIDSLRSQYRTSRYMARKLVHVLLWTEGWQSNFGFDDQGLLPTLENLNASDTCGLITLNSGDPLLPAGQADDVKKTWPTAAQTFEVEGHGLCAPSVCEKVHEWLDQQRLKYCGNDTNALASRKQLVQDQRSYSLDMNLILQGSEDIAGLQDTRLATIALLISQRGNRDEILELCSSLPQMSPAQINDQLERKNISPQRLAFEEARLAYFIKGKQTRLADRHIMERKVA